MKKRKRYEPDIEYLDDMLVIDAMGFPFPADYPDSIFSLQDIIDIWMEMNRVKFAKDVRDSIQMFIIDCDRLCYRMKRTLNLQKTGFGEDKKRVLTRIQRAIEELKKLDENPYLYGYLLGVSPDMLLDIWKPDEIIKKRIAGWSGAQIDISQLLSQLKKIKSVIENSQQSESVKGIDPFNFASIIAVLYVAYFKRKPTKTKNGPFYNIVLICYKAVGLRDKDQDGNEKVADVYNHVTAAVDGLRWSYPKFSNPRSHSY